MIHAHQPIWLPSHVTVEKKLPWGVRWFDSSILRFDHFLIVFKENKITVKSSFMKFNITENKTVFLNLTKYFELTSVFQGGVIL